MIFSLEIDIDTEESVIKYYKPLLEVPTQVNKIFNNQNINCLSII